MNDTPVQQQEPEIQLVELGDAKRLTQGPVAPNMGEDHPTLIFREM